MSMNLDPREPREPTDEEIELQMYAGVGRAYINLERLKEEIRLNPVNTRNDLSYAVRVLTAMQELDEACKPIW